MAAACSQLTPAARPANPPVLNLPPPPSAADRPSVAQAPLPPPVAPPIAPAIGAGALPAQPSRNSTAALLLPLSGASAAIGSALFNAAQLALFEVGGGSFTLLPFDTKGTPEGAAAAAQQAVAQHAEIIVGPLFSAEARAVAPVTRQAGVPMLAFTTDQTVAGNGVYVLGFLPGPQALRVVAFARSQNRPWLAILAPSDEYGRTVVDYLSNNAPGQGVSIAQLQFYDPNATDFTGPIKRLLGPRGEVGFDALILPDEGQRLRQVAASLATQGIDPAQVKLLGTMLWEDSKPATEPALVGGWYTAPPVAQHADFDGRYAKAFGVKPPRLAALGYDATALAGVVARRSAHDFSPGVLTNPLGFSGVDGIFRLRPDGTVERGYAVMEVQPVAPPREVDPAPAQFQAAY